MSDQDRKRGLTAEQWAEVRKAYETEKPPPSIVTLSKRFKVKRDTIMRHRDDPNQAGGPWIPQSGQFIGQMTDSVRAETKERAKAKVISIATRQAVDEAKADGTIDAIAKQVKSGLLLHAELEELMLEFAADTLRRALGKDGASPLRAGTHTSEAGERKDAMATVAMALDKSREIHGKTAGKPSVEDETAGGKPTILELEIVEAPTGTDG